MKKLISGFMVLIIVLCGLGLAGFLQSGIVQASTPVSGTISDSTTWTQANSPYTLTGNVIVTGTLTIEPGVTVNINQYSLEVQGNLRAQGNSSNPIQLIRGSNITGAFPNPELPPVIKFTSNSTSWNETTGQGCIISNANITNLRGEPGSLISINGGSPKISNCELTSSNVWNSGDNAGSSIWVDDGHPMIVNNSITGVYGVALNLYTPSTSTAIVADNIIYGGGVGIEITAGNPIIEHNLIMNNTHMPFLSGGGIRLYYESNATIRDNMIVFNTYGIYFSNASATVTGNSIFGNDEYNVYLLKDQAYDTNANINASNNYWGASDVEAIDHTIYDFKDNTALGNVIYMPYLQSSPSSNPRIPECTIRTYTMLDGANSYTGMIGTMYGCNVTVYIPNRSGYNLTDVIVNGTSVGATNTYVINRIKASNLVVTAVFVSINPTSTPTPSPTPSSSPIPPTSNSLSVILLSPNTNSAITNSQNVSFIYLPFVTGTSMVGRADLYVNNVLVASNQSAILNGVNNTINYMFPANGNYVWNIRVQNQTSFEFAFYNFYLTVAYVEPTPTPTPTPTTSPTTSPIPTSTPAPKPTPTIDLFCRSYYSGSTYRVYITGNLSSDGTPILADQLFLSYSVNGGTSWIDLTTAVTDGTGAFAETWNLQVTGSYLLKATYSGSSTYDSTSKIVNFIVAPYQKEGENTLPTNVFSLTSNSSVTSLFFNSTSQELSFTVNGTTGTTGYVSIYMPKTLVNNTQALKVYLDGTPLTYTATDQGDSILVTFNYHHSTHEVTIAVDAQATEPVAEGLNPWILVGVVTAAVLAIAALVVVFRAKKKTPH